MRWHTSRLMWLRAAHRRGGDVGLEYIQANAESSTMEMYTVLFLFL